ncbi:hypothetical protein [Mesorhizobium sp. M5C.F.Cr.IN.023.01.1.1]|nr:hypothetical protein [Mesorhizobium sp. M5C.F.Cr.IN.023.01.1.1]
MMLSISSPAPLETGAMLSFVERSGLRLHFAAVNRQAEGWQILEAAS